MASLEDRYLDSEEGHLVFPREKDAEQKRKSQLKKQRKELNQVKIIDNNSSNPRFIMAQWVEVDKSFASLILRTRVDSSSLSSSLPETDKEAEEVTSPFSHHLINGDDANGEKGSAEAALALSETLEQVKFHPNSIHSGFAQRSGKQLDHFLSEFAHYLRGYERELHSVVPYGITPSGDGSEIDYFGLLAEAKASLCSNGQRTSQKRHPQLLFARCQPHRFASKAKSGGFFSERDFRSFIYLSKEQLMKGKHWGANEYNRHFRTPGGPKSKDEEQYVFASIGPEVTYCHKHVQLVCLAMVDDDEYAKAREVSTPTTYHQHYFLMGKKAKMFQNTPRLWSVADHKIIPLFYVYFEEKIWSFPAGEHQQKDLQLRIPEVSESFGIFDKKAVYWGY